MVGQIEYQFDMAEYIIKMLLSLHINVHFLIQKLYLFIKKCNSKQEIYV